MFRGRGMNRGPPRGGGFRSFAPVKPGDELNVTIEAVGEKGDGIAKKDGFVIFVPGVKEGDNVRIRVTKVFKKVGFGEVVGSSEGSKESVSEESDEGSEGAEESEEPEGSGEAPEEASEETQEEESSGSYEDTENF